jgi:hypothetical protein
MTKTLRFVYDNTPVSSSGTYQCSGTAPAELARFQNEVAELENLEQEGHIRIDERHRESFSGYRYVDVVRFTRLK